MRGIKLFIPSIIFLLTGCSEGPGNVNEETRTAFSPETQIEKEIEIDSPYLSGPQDFPAILESIEADFPLFNLPFIVAPDSLKENSKKSELSLKQLKYISTYFSPLDKYEGFYIQKAKELYKLKAEKKYVSYLNELDLGGLRDATVHPYGRIELDTALLLLWRIDFSSYEACPFYAGSELYISIVTGDTVNKCYLLAEEWSGGDPPAFGSHETYVKINKTLLIDRTIREYTFEDEELIDSAVVQLKHQLEW